jgi:hypothetical protein
MADVVTAALKTTDLGSDVAGAEEAADAVADAAVDKADEIKGQKP